ncbi:MULTISPECIES: hypothetical protein [unclassified Bosea (in: a-proteobacteria)]|uniref:hypothetical protein n=1 Tax=unclassified Bosea (in: a-proteobacteria) TaxID=2653178 RepID=UPI000F75EA9A|nr:MULTISPECIES: hypothetical protein [unclassified Bosea (in: a-proteobacteria)]AZO76301.1 hypothetical protein BLM15_00850 [Bosea sp. Tri-49]RXT26230.1 hypothetical protein B5U98_06760 [Bosea sp. Tri-39]RXT31472.1 hypothetical protein B5U99_22305 [Bosea sp. Tri-54]
MTRFLKLLLPILLALPLMSATARAQSPAGIPCADRRMATTQLHELYGERRIGYGLAANGSVIELFAAPNGSFTLFATLPHGVSCLIATGQSWEPPPEPDYYAGR